MINEVFVLLEQQLNPVVPVLESSGTTQAGPLGETLMNVCSGLCSAEATLEARKSFVLDYVCWRHLPVWYPGLTTQPWERESVV